MDLTEEEIAIVHAVLDWAVEDRPATYFDVWKGGKNGDWLGRCDVNAVRRVKTKFDKAVGFED